jgi:cytoskeleton protein RodZ
MNTQTNLDQAIAIDQLQQHREAKELSIRTVADNIKVSSDFIRYIESGAFEKLGAPTFIRGHVTNYCKQLGLDPAQILSQIPAHLLTSQSFQNAEGLASSPLARVRRRSNHLGKYAVGTALLGMLGLSFYFVWDKWSMPVGQIEPADLQLVDQPADTPATVDTEKKPKVTYSSLLPQVNMPQQPEITIQQPVSDEADDGLQSAGDVGADATVESTETDNQDGTAGNDLQIMAGYSIQLDIKEQAWVSIKTADGENVVHDLLEPGIRNYHSSEPVHVRIGNAKNTRLIINDTAVDLTPFMRRDIADFAWPQNPG